MFVSVDNLRRCFRELWSMYLLPFVISVCTSHYVLRDMANMSDKVVQKILVRGRRGEKSLCWVLNTPLNQMTQRSTLIYTLQMITYLCKGKSTESGPWQYSCMFFLKINHRCRHNRLGSLSVEFRHEANVKEWSKRSVCTYCCPRHTKYFFLSYGIWYLYSQHIVNVNNETYLFYSCAM